MKRLEATDDGIEAIIGARRTGAAYKLGLSNFLDFNFN
jgi:hypothetical protein